MKLIDLLVNELPKRGGWPGSQYDGDVMALEGVSWSYKEGCYPTAYSDGVRVIRSEYEAALAASQRPTWNGEGLPPVGCEVELVNFYGEDFPEFVGDTGEKVKIIGNGFTNSYPVAFYEADGGRGSVLAYAVSKCFRPILTQAERKREDAIETLNRLYPQLVGKLAGYLYDDISAGKIPHITLK